MSTDQRPWHRAWIARNFTSACLSRRCTNCTCGRSIEFELEEEADDPDDYGLTS